MWEEKQETIGERHSKYSPSFQLLWIDKYQKNGGRETGNNWRKTQQILTFLSVFVDRQIPKSCTKPLS